MTITFDFVEALHKKFNLPKPDKPALLNKELLEFRSKFMHEEVKEFIIAHNEGNLEDAFDALIDLIYVIYGTLYFMGIDKQMLFDGFVEVHNANMKKEKVERASESKRGHSFDLKKPADWKAPNHSKILKKEK